MWSLDACMLCLLLLLALLNPAAAGAGFSLPLVSSHHSTADKNGYLQVIAHQDHGTDDEIEELLPPAGGGAANLTRIRPKIALVDWPVFSVVVGVGSGHHRHFYKLAMDFVGGLTWIQCKPCVPELRQEGPVFDSGLSPRYKCVLPPDRDCKPPYVRSGQDRCSFNVRLRDATAHGYLGKDVFTFAGTTDSVDSLIFGCAHTTHAFANHGVLAGVVSLNRESTSFISQLIAHGVVHRRFSYCLFYAATASHGFLRFGRDVPKHRADTQSTPLLLYNVFDKYYIGIVGVSINGRQIKSITPAMLKRDQRMQRGGCIVDAGTPLTRMVRALLPRDVAGDPPAHTGAVPLRRFLGSY